MPVEYRVRPVTRYIVTRYEDGAGSTQIGEYPSAETAQSVGHAMCDAERVKAGEPLDSMAFVYPGALATGGFVNGGPSGAYGKWAHEGYVMPTLSAGTPVELRPTPDGQGVTVTIDTRGATGNAEIERMVEAGVKQTMRTMRQAKLRHE